MREKGEDIRSRDFRWTERFGEEEDEDKDRSPLEEEKDPREMLTARAAMEGKQKQKKTEES